MEHFRRATKEYRRDHPVITIFAMNGPDQLMIACRRGPAAVERCTVVSSGDGSVEQAILKRIGRKGFATRSHQWEPWHTH